MKAAKNRRYWGVLYKVGVFLRDNILRALLATCLTAFLGVLALFLVTNPVTKCISNFFSLRDLETKVTEQRLLFKDRGVDTNIEEVEAFETDLSSRKESPCCKNEYDKLYGDIEMLLADYYLTKWKVRKADGDIRKAINKNMEALEYIDKDECPLEYIQINNSLGESYYELYETNNKYDNLTISFACYNNARIALEAIESQDVADYSDEEIKDRTKLHLDTLGGLIMVIAQSYSVEKETTFIGKEYIGYYYSTALDTLDNLKKLSYEDYQEEFSKLCKYSGDIDSMAADSIGEEDTSEHYCDEGLSDEEAIVQAIGNKFGGILQLMKEAYYEDAIQSYLKSVDTVNREKSADEYARCNLSLGDVYLKLYYCTDEEDNLEKSNKYYSNALKVFRLDDHPIEFAKVKDLLARNYIDLFYDTGKTDYLLSAIGPLREADTAWSTINKPFGYYYGLHKYYTALLDHNIYLNYKDCQGRLSKYAEYRSKNLINPVKDYEDALVILTETAFPTKYAKIQFDLGKFYYSLSKTDNETENIGLSTNSYKRAVDTCINEDLFISIDQLKDYKVIFEYLSEHVDISRRPLDYATAMSNLGAIYLFLYEKNERCESLKENSLRAYTKALRGYEKEKATCDNEKRYHNLATVIECIANIYIVLYDNTNNREYLISARKAFKEAKDIYDDDLLPLLGREIDMKQNTLREQIKGHL
jgi:tetratricopeptide (TPR) repeat protein